MHTLIKIVISLLGIVAGILLIVFTEPVFHINLGIVFLIFWVFGYLGASLKTVGPNELAMETFFDKPVNHYKPGKGLVLVPLGFYKLEKVSSVTHQFQIPGDPEKVFKGKDTEPLPDESWVRPMRIFTGQEDSPSKDPLSERLHGVFSAIIRWRILDFNKFTRNIGSTKEAERQMRDTVEKVLVEVLGKMSPRQIIDGISTINAKLVEALQKLVNGDDNGEDGWGIKIEDFQLLAPDFGQTLSSSISEARSASFKKEATIKTAEGEAESIKLKGNAEAESLKAQGLAEAEVLRAKGVSTADAKKLLLQAEATGLKQLAKELKISDKALLLQLEAFKQAIGKAGENGHIFFNMPNIASIPELFGAINKTKG